MADVAKGSLELAIRPLIDEVVDVDIWRYRYYGGTSLHVKIMFSTGRYTEIMARSVNSSCGCYLLDQCYITGPFAVYELM